ncbi:MAG: hypothetical protein ACOX3J_03640 [Clostridia bacterium]
MSKTMKYIRNNSGASIIFVVIISMVFLIAGASVLTAASMLSSTSIKNHTNKQVYYYAKSAAEVVSKEIVGDEGFGYEIINYIGLIGATHNNGENNTEELVDVPAEIVLDCNITLLKNSTPYDDVEYDNVQIKLSGIQLIKFQSYQHKSGRMYDVLERYDLEIEKVAISFTTRHNGEEYKLALEYTFSAKGERKAECERRTNPVSSIRDLNLSPLHSKHIDWREFDRIFVRVHQNEVH